MAIKRESRPDQVRGYLDDVHEMTTAAAAHAAPEPAALGPADSADSPSDIESTEFTVTLEGLDPAAKITVIKVLRRLTDLGLREAKDLVETAPQPIKENVSRDEAESIKEELEQAGAHVSVDLSDVARQWRAVSDKLAEGDVVEGEVVRKIKGGLIVNIGVNVFLPASQVDLRRPADCGDYVGRRITCKVLSIDRVRRNIVVSRRQLVEDERAENKKRLLTEIEPGQVRRGIVTRIADFGAFIDLGGIEGLIHISEMSWDRVKDPRDVVRTDQELEVRVLDVDKDRERVQLSLKQTAWQSAKPPMMDAIVPQTAHPDQPLMFQATACDPEGDELTFQLVGTPPAGASMDGRGHFRWTPTWAQLGSYTFTVRATDSGGLFDSKSFTVSVENQPPTLDPLPDPGSCHPDQPIMFTASANDPDGDILTFTLVSGPAGASIDADGNFNWTPTWDQLGNHTITVRVSDPGGLSHTRSRTLAVVNNAPVLDPLPAPPSVLTALEPFENALVDAVVQELLARVGSVLRARGIGVAEAADIVSEIARTPPQADLLANAEAASVVLERFSGFVDRVEGEIAYVTLTSEHGDTLLGEYPFSDLRKLGIQERRGFECATRKTGGKIVVDMHALPQQTLSQQEHHDIRSRVDQLVADAEFDGEQ